MARSHARILTSIWSDPDFTALTPQSQRLYLFLLSQPKLTMVGVIDLMPGRWASKAAGMTINDIRTSLADLEHARFIVVDPIEEELLVRSIVKIDEAKNFKSRLGMWAAYEAVSSRRLRHVIAHEMPEHMFTDEQALPKRDGLELRKTPRSVPIDPPIDPVIDPPIDPPTDPVRGRVPPASCLMPTADASCLQPIDALTPQPERTPGTSLAAKRVNPPATFLAWYERYPRKAHRTEAEKQYTAAIKLGATPEQLTEALEAWITQWRIENRPADKIPHPGTWLNKGSWRDIPEHRDPIVEGVQAIDRETWEALGGSWQ